MLFFLVVYSFKLVYLSVIATKIRKCVESNGVFRYVSVKHYFSNSSHGSLPDVLDNLYLDTTICPR